MLRVKSQTINRRRSRKRWRRNLCSRRLGSQERANLVVRSSRT